MTPDLSKLKPGDTVHFRCGGSAVVGDISGLNDGDFYLWFVGFKGLNAQTFRNDGTFYGQPKQTPFDIIRIESAFRWEDVRPGSAFQYEDPHDSETKDAYFVCVDVSGEPCFSIEDWACPQTLGPINARNIRPNPSKDIEVKT